MTPSIGEHLARLRRAAGLSQEALAERAHVSLSVIRQLEQQQRTSARISTLARLAAALAVDTTALMGDASTAVDRRDPTAEPVGLVPVRRALTPIHGLDGAPLAATTPDGPEPTLATLTHDLAEASRLYHADDYAAVLAGLPRLLGDARALVDLTTGDAQLAAHTAASRVYQLAGRLLIQLRQVDLAHTALTEAARHARASGDQVVAAEAVAPMCWHLIRVGRLADARALAVDTADRVEPRMSTASPAALASWGFLLVKAASAAVRDARRSEAEEILQLADAAAQVLGDRPYPHAQIAGNDFSREGVHLMRVETLVISGRHAEALTLAQQAPRSAQVTPSGRQRHRLDVAWAHLHTGDRDAAVEVLAELRRVAPSWLRQQPYARVIVDTLVRRTRRRVSAELADLLAMVGYH